MRRVNRTRYGERLVCVRYRYDEGNGRRLKTVKLIVAATPWRPAPRRRDEEIVAVPIAYAEAELRERARRLGAIWRPAQRLCEMTWLDAKRLGVAARVRPDT